MKDELFQELLESIREGGAILRGEAAPARSFSVADPDVAAVRELYGLSQTQFAGLLGISVRTLQNWEQRRRKPEGPARVLLRVAARHPEAVVDVVREEPGKKLSTPTRRKKVGRATSQKPARTQRKSLAGSRKSPARTGK